MFIKLFVKMFFRVLFCNTLGCNNQRVPWSEPVMNVDREPKAPQHLVRIFFFSR